MTRRSILSFATFALAGGAGYACWRWLVTRGSADGIPWPFRRALETNEKLSRAVFSQKRNAREFDPSQAVGQPRPNGRYGLRDPSFDPMDWELRVEGIAGRAKPLFLTLDDIMDLPKVTQTTELNCIEGWTNVVTWGGARFSDFVARYPPATRSGKPADPKNNPDDNPDNLVEYVAMSTPDRQYYVGLDMASALQPQTLLCYEIDGKPLLPEHGAPLRLVIPTKYGIKNIKRIGAIRFTSKRPPDYWAERGYDWYAGL